MTSTKPSETRNDGSRGAPTHPGWYWAQFTKAHDPTAWVTDPDVAWGPRIPDPPGRSSGQVTHAWEREPYDGHLYMDMSSVRNCTKHCRARLDIEVGCDDRMLWEDPA